MKKILIVDAFCASHVGNGALLDNSYGLLKSLLGDDIDISICAWEPEPFKEKYPSVYGLYFPQYVESKLGKLSWLILNSLFVFLQLVNQKTFKLPPTIFTWSKRQRDYIRLVEEADICVSISGEALNETFKKILPLYLFSYWYPIKRGKKFIIFPQSVGPFNSPFWMKLVYNSLKNASLYYGRDEYSIAELHRLGFQREKIIFSPDVAIFQETKEVDVHTYFKNNDKKIIGVTVSSPPAEVSSQPDYGVIISNALKEQVSSDEYKILIMPSNYELQGKSKDYRLCEKVKGALQESFEVAILDNRIYFVDEFKGLLSKLDFYISTRMHVLIIAYSGGIPTIGINTQRKIRGFQKNIHMEKLCIDIQNLEKELPVKINKVIAENEILRKEIKANIKELQEFELNALSHVKKVL